jgi:phytoene synthase
MTSRLPTPPAGSSIYYALALVPAQHRSTLRNWWHWWHEVSSIPFNIQDPGVAEAKLVWWRGEVEAAAKGQATHPVTQAMFAAQKQDPSAQTKPDLTLWLMQIDGLIDLIHQTRWLDAPVLKHHQTRTTAAAAEGCAVLLGAETAAAREAACHMGLGWRQVHQLARLGRDARAGWVHVPVDVLQNHDVRAHELTKPAPMAGANWAGLLSYLCEQAKTQLTLGLDQVKHLPRSERRALIPLTALTQMQLSLLKEIESSGDRILHERLLLTPLRKWWIAQRVRLGLL